MVDFLRRHWFLVLLAGVLAAGITMPETLGPVARGVPRDWVIAAVLLLTSLSLNIEAFLGTARSPGPALLATGINYAVVPAIAWVVGMALDADLRLGLLVAVAAPSTLASAAIWTRMAGGNPATSIVVTILTNLGCFLATPAILLLTTGHSAAGLSFGQAAAKLLLLIVLPMLVGQGLRLLAPIRNWALAHGPALGSASQMGVLVIIFIGAVLCGQKLSDLGPAATGMAWRVPWMIVCVCAMHLASWAAAYRAAAAVGLPRAERIAVGFSGSQKTLAVGLAVALDYGGLTILPVLAHHVLQLLIDTVIVSRLRRKGE